MKKAKPIGHDGVVISSPWNCSRLRQNLLLKLAKTETILVSEEEMQRLAFDNRPIRRYCFQCRGPKFMVPAKPNMDYQEGLAGAKTPERLSIACKTCRVKYTAKIGLQQ